MREDEPAFVRKHKVPLNEDIDVELALVEEETEIICRKYMSEDRSDLQRKPRWRRQAVHACLHQAAHAAGNRAARLGLGVAEQLIKEERVAGRAPDAGIGVGGVDAVVAPREGGGLVGGQCAEIDGEERRRRRPATAKEVAVSPRGHEQEGRQVPDTCGNPGEEIQRGCVSPMQVLHDKQKGMLPAAVLNQPAEGRSGAGRACFVVHCIEELPEPQVELLPGEVEKDGHLHRHEAGRLKRGGGGLGRPSGICLQHIADRRPRQLGQGTSSVVSAEIENEPEPDGKPFLRRKPPDLFGEARLADSRLAPQVDRLP